MTILQAVREATRRLRGARVDSPSLDAGILLAHALKKPKEYIIAHPETKLLPTHQRRFFALVLRRARREPVAYLTGHKEFYGLDFVVNRRVLIPRPDTETLVRAVLEKVSGFRFQVLVIDVGTGSGAIVIALAKKLKAESCKLKALATDVSAAALRVARENARRHQVSVKFLKGNLLEPLGDLPPSFRYSGNLVGSGLFNDLIITANLPYLPTREWRKTQPEIRTYEPRRALDGGPDGLRYYRELIVQLKTFESGIRNQESGIMLLLEFDPEQTTALKKLVRRAFPNARLEIKKDLAGRNRILIAEIPSIKHRAPNKS